MVAGMSKAGTAQIFINDERVGYGLIADECEQPPSNKLDITGLQTEYSFDVENVSGGWDTIWDMLVREHRPTSTITYKPGRQWFQPTITMQRATINQTTQQEIEDAVQVSFDVHAPGYDVQWPNRWARPVHWLWRHCIKITALFRKCR